MLLTLFRYSKDTVLTEELGEPEWLVVVLHGDGAGVEEDEDDDEPEPPLLLAHPPHPELELLQRQHQAWII
jgi:hypothetical protein